MYIVDRYIYTYVIYGVRYSSNLGTSSQPYRLRMMER